MKCPKCGFNSFEFYDVCKKCSADQSAYKQTYAINTLVLPLEVKEKRAAENRSSTRNAVEIPAVTASHEDMFSFELPDENPAAPVTRHDDPFNFDVPLPENQLAESKTEDDVFADLLESTSQTDESLFSGQTHASPAPASLSPQKNAGSSTNGSGEFDLDSFSWDEEPPASAVSGVSEAPDDFDSLFGDTKENPAK